MHAVKALRMARHQDQQRVRMAAQQLSMSRQHNFILTRMGAGRDPDRALTGLPLFAQPRGMGQQLRINRQIKLDRAGDGNAFRTCAQLPKTLSLSLSLHREPAHFFQHRPGQLGKPCITPRRSLGQPRIGQSNRNAAPGTLMNMVRPQLGLHNHAKHRSHMIKKTPRRPWQIIGQVAMLNARLVGEHRLDTLRTGGRHAGDRDRQLWISGEQRTNHRRSSNAFTHRHCMHPDAARLHDWQAQRETLTDSLAIGRCLACSQPQSNGHQWQADMKQQGI